MPERYTCIDVGSTVRASIHGNDDSPGQVVDVDRRHANVLQGAVRQRAAEGLLELDPDGRVVVRSVDRPRLDDDHGRSRPDSLDDCRVSPVLRFVVVRQESVREVTLARLVYDTTVGIAKRVGRRVVDDARY